MNKPSIIKLLGIIGILGIRIDTLKNLLRRKIKLVLKISKNSRNLAGRYQYQIINVQVKYILSYTTGPSGRWPPTALFHHAFALRVIVLSTQHLRAKTFFVLIPARSINLYFWRENLKSTYLLPKSQCPVNAVQHTMAAATGKVRAYHLCSMIGRC